MQTTTEPAREHQWDSLLKSFSFLFVTTSIAAYLLFFGVDRLQGNYAYHSPVYIFNGYFGYFLWEIRQQPFAYLLSISFFLSLLGALWLGLVVPRTRRFHALQALAVPWIAMLITSPVWGLIWSMYRWPPQGFSDTSIMMMFYRHDIGVGLSLGWLSAIISFPINILSYIVVYILLLISKRLFLHRDKSPES
jgi:hypothetical protein